MGMILPDQWMIDIAERYPDVISGVALAALGGDEFSEEVLCDFIEEEGIMVNPFEVGKSYLICTVTLYYVGRVTESSLGWIKLDDASWVHWTGRLSVLLSDQLFKNSRFGTRKPRTEYCGEVLIPTTSIVSVYPWNAKLPGESVE